MKNLKTIAGAATFVAATSLAGGAWAVIEFNDDVTPDVIFGSGNTNGEFTTDRRNGIEIGILAKIPFVPDLINSNNNGTYSYTLAETALNGVPKRWNFDWTVNTDFNGTSGLFLDDLTYELGMDADPGLGVNFLKFDPITPGVTVPDHAIGDNFTNNGGGIDTYDAPTYLTLLATKNVLQQSWRYSFFPVEPLAGYNPDIPGTYAVYLLARDGNGDVVARSDIQVLIEGASPAGPIVSCEGFEPPLDEDVIVNKPNRVLPLRIVLVDSNGVSLTDADITTAPVLQVDFTGINGGGTTTEILDSVGKGDDGNTFTFGDDKWAFNMKTKGLSPGNYKITAVSGDLAEYVIDPTCMVSVDINS